MDFDRHKQIRKSEQRCHKELKYRVQGLSALYRVL